MPIDVAVWPMAPKEHRPKSLYIMEVLSAEDAQVLKDKGWKPRDVRRLPNESDHERSEALKCFLEGVRIGSIAPLKQQLAFLELEAKIYGLTSSRGVTAPPSRLADGTVEDLLNFADPPTAKSHISNAKTPANTQVPTLTENAS
jgi:hypothetical protein